MTQHRPEMPLHFRPRPDSRTPLVVLLFWIAATIMTAIAVITSGCASHATRQTDRRPDGTEITTRARSVAFMAGKSAMRDVKVSQTEKTQGMSVGALDQESDATKLSEAIGAVLVKGLIAYMTGGASTMVPGASAPTALAIPAGFKLVPKDDPSTSKPEVMP